MTQSTPTPLLELFAERLLHGTTLADKLAPPRLDESPTSFDPGQCRPNFVPPLLPGRPPQLSLSAVSMRRSTHVFPTKGSLDNPLARGHVLHFFANHELLAIEIMALAILKFHDAPAGFVRGIYETILEEQKHMHLYIDRMNDLGVAFGEISLNGFFWNSLKDMSSPQEYAAAMSLTFEQANLDFSLHYENSFRTLGDLKTANILETIRRDEIGHVRHGLIWFDRWRDPSRTLWQEYLTHLKFPMTPMRAKGPTFDLEGRQRAGLPGDYIHTLEAFSSSKGRPPKVLWFNPSCEEEIRAKGLGYSPPTTVRQLTEDLSVLMMHFGHNDDLLMTTAEPSHPWLIQLRKLGFEIPEIIAPITTTDDTLKERKIAGLEPWGWSPAAHHQRQLMAKKTIRALVHDSPELWQETPPSRNIFSKTFAASLRGPKDLKGEVATDTELVLKACTHTSASASPSASNRLVSFKNGSYSG